MLCLVLQPGQKSGMILPFEVVLELKLPKKNHFNKECAPKWKKKSERFGGFLTKKIHFESPIFTLCDEQAKLG